MRHTTEIIVVDNNSTDHSVAEIKKIVSDYKKTILISLIQNQENVGFAKANNQALKVAQGKYILLLNSDTIVQTGALEVLVNAFQTAQAAPQHDKLGLVAASLWNQNGTYQPQGGDQVSLLAAKVQWLMLDDLPIIGKYLPSLQRKLNQPSINRPVQLMGWVGATALCFSRKLYEAIGGLDESIFMYAEDIEFCLRAKRAGWESAIVHQAKVTHIGSASGNSEQAKLGEVRGLLIFWPNYFGSTSTFLLKIIITMGCCLRIALFTLIERDERAKTYNKILNQLWV